MKTSGTTHAGAWRRRLSGNPFPRPAFDFVFEDAGIQETAGVFDGAWVETVDPVDATVVSGGGSPVAVWRKGKRAVTFGAAAGNLGSSGGMASSSTERTWFFALRIPASAAFTTGIGPSSSATELLKNFPLYFKATNVMGSQPSASNRDSALDMSPYDGLDAIISVRQAAAGIRFVMRIAGVSGRVVTTASGEACGTTQGLSIGGWFGGGGLLGEPIALVGCINSALSDADQNAGVDWAAWEYDLLP